MRGLQVIGDPVLHSLSPQIHGAMLAELGLDIPYEAHVVKKGELPAYLARAKETGLLGFNATMPHKEDLIPLLDGLDGDAARCGAVNTVCIRAGRAVGYNTDGEGCLAALKEAGMWPSGPVILLGAGGAAKAVGLKLAAAGAERVWVCSRTYGRVEALCALDPAGVMRPARWEELSRLCRQGELLVNCTNAGMNGSPQFDSLAFVDELPRGAGVFDLIYHPAETGLLARARGRGLAACNGLPMLIHQAICALEHFLDRPLDRGVMAHVVGEALKERI